MRITSGFPSVRPISTKRDHEGWTRRIYPISSAFPAVPAALTTRFAASSVSDSGFSQKTCAPAANACKAMAA